MSTSMHNKMKKSTQVQFELNKNRLFTVLGPIKSSNWKGTNLYPKTGHKSSLKEYSKRLQSSCYKVDFPLLMIYPIYMHSVSYSADADQHSSASAMPYYTS